MACRDPAGAWRATGQARVEVSSGTDLCGKHSLRLMSKTRYQVASLCDLGGALTLQTYVLGVAVKAGVAVAAAPPLSNHAIEHKGCYVDGYE